MCSLSWHHQQDGYEVFFNRDEKKTRGRASPPAPGQLSGVRHLSPKDADGGGTWLLANEYGVTIALLNYWNMLAKEKHAALSRGSLLSGLLAAHTSASAVVEQLHDVPLQGYGSFTLAAFDLTLVEGPMVVRWDGESLNSLPHELPLCSSSFLPEAVIRSRQRDFQALPDQRPETLWDWHRKEEAPTAYTVRMNRPDAQTWCISRVSVTIDSIRWCYIEELPDLQGSPEVHEAILTP
jgi:hypothetical protein